MIRKLRKIDLDRSRMLSERPRVCSCTFQSPDSRSAASEWTSNRPPDGDRRWIQLRSSTMGALVGDVLGGSLDRAHAIALNLATEKAGE
jgi:hypothetical protein